MKNTIFALLLTFLISCQQQKQEIKPEEVINKELTAEEKKQYRTLVGEASKLYNSDKYLQSAKKYADALRLGGYQGHTTDAYNAACSWALAKEVDSAFVPLFLIIEGGSYTNYNHLINDRDLSILHADKRWDQLLELIIANKEKAEANFDKPLVAKLDSIFQDDQEPRRRIRAVQEKYGANSEELKALWAEIREKDSMNVVKVEKILRERGWPGKELIGEQGNRTLFFVIQHADLDMQEKYLPLVREVVQKGGIKPRSFALLEDRIAMRKGKRQIYGTQLRRDSNEGERYFYPIKDPDYVDERRASVGLGPLEEYAARFNLTWDLEAYKQQLPALEKRLKIE